MVKLAEIMKDDSQKILFNESSMLLEDNSKYSYKVSFFQCTILCGGLEKKVIEFCRNDEFCKNDAKSQRSPFEYWNKF